MEASFGQPIQQEDQLDINDVTFTELNHFLLLSPALCLPLCLSLSFEQKDLNNSECHGFVQVIIPMCAALAGLGKVLLTLCLHRTITVIQHLHTQHKAE